MGGGGMMGGHHDADTPAMSSMMASASAAPGPSSSAAVAPAPAAEHGHGSAHDSAPRPPDPHGHHSHAPVKEFLNDTEIHLWHKFPPTYLDADFRLTQDSVIFGEELPADWPGDTPSHPGLMIVHVVSMCLAYFGALPIGESSCVGWVGSEFHMPRAAAVVMRRRPADSGLRFFWTHGTVRDVARLGFRAGPAGILGARLHWHDA